MSIFVGVEEGLVPEKQQTFNVTGHPYSEHRWEKGKYGQEKLDFLISKKQ